MEFAQRLKTETTPQHKSLEQKLNLLRPEMTLADYSHVIERFYGFYVTLESEFFSNPHDNFFDDRKKSASLEADLKSLGINPALVKKISPARLPQMDSSEKQLGIMYVLEGSTLGGQVLQKHFHQKFDLTPEHGMSYFCGYKEQTMPRWRDFQRLLAESSHKNSLKQDVIIHSAQQTFLSLEEWLTGDK